MKDQSGDGHQSRTTGISAGPTLPLTWRLADLRPAPTSVADARRQAQDVLSRWSQRGALPQDDTLLLLDELASNAVRHAHTPFTVTMSLDDAALRGAVHDYNPRPPVLRTPSADDLGGRGIYLVAALADRWGVDQHAGDGKTVWFEIDTKP